MKKLALLAVVPLLLVSSTAVAQPLPPEVEVFYLDTLTCVVWPDGNGDCYCPCEVDCEIENVETPKPPSDTAPTPDVTPIPSEEPEPTEKAACNRGIGNASEGCDPGNSSGQGKGDGRKAGEDRDE